MLCFTWVTSIDYFKMIYFLFFCLLLHSSKNGLPQAVPYNQRKTRTPASLLNLDPNDRELRARRSLVSSTLLVRCALWHLLICKSSRCCLCAHIWAETRQLNIGTGLLLATFTANCIRWHLYTCVVKDNTKTKLTWHALNNQLKGRTAAVQTVRVKIREKDIGSLMEMKDTGERNA